MWLSVRPGSPESVPIAGDDSMAAVYPISHTHRFRPDPRRMHAARPFLTLEASLQPGERGLHATDIHSRNLGVLRAWSSPPPSIRGQLPGFPSRHAFERLSLIGQTRTNLRMALFTSRATTYLAFRPPRRS
ncbi:hypothetical protein GSI_04978 [Ganoderma sinense ZZ0214-1]|uniref:Uncharacterized protein n=1 Tax=Ganoderma sinense ZZ0214-1 TaxID=1077348 RepID=A0A2G8SGF7_9APHY|nr:hypothetical protein GSI_04978 [Ganoderma sinense ZZ0214-1]